MLIKMAWRTIAYRPFQHGILMVIIALAVALSVLVLLLNNGITRGLTAATEPFDLLVGAKGSDNQLVLNTVFLQDRPIGNIPYATILSLRQQQQLVKKAIPLAFGDNYKGFRIVGTEPEIFRHQVNELSPPWLQLTEGNIFSEPYEAVLGAKTAEMTGLKIGDTFTSIHGIASGPGTEAHSHKHPYIVTGILAPVKGPYDQAILTDIHTIWETHEHHDEGVSGQDNSTGRPLTAAQRLAKEAQPRAESPTLAGDKKNELGDVTAIMVQPSGYSQALRLYQQFQNNRDSQLVFPAQVVVRLFALLGQGEKTWRFFGGAIIAITLFVVMLTMYWSALSRMREQAILRAMGASTRVLFHLLLLENAMVVCFGAALGWCLGEAVYLLIQAKLASTTAITMNTEFYPVSLIVVVATVAIGVLGGTVPSWLLHRKEIARWL